MWHCYTVIGFDQYAGVNQRYVLNILTVYMKILFSSYSSYWHIFAQKCKGPCRHEKSSKPSVVLKSGLPAVMTTHSLFAYIRSYEA